MNIYFLGGKSVGYGILEHLKKTDDVVGVRSSSIQGSWYPRLKTMAWTGAPIDMIVCAYYDHILTEKELTAPAINIHMGLVQEYRGCYPTTWPILHGKKEAGVTIHEITPEIDGGRVYAQARVSVDEYDTGKSLYYKCTGAAVSLFKEKWDEIKSGKLRPKKVKISEDYYSRDSFPDHKIDLDWTGKKIDRHVRALTFSPFPKPYFEIKGRKYEVDPASQAIG